jgi:tetraacyldisaccharide 4'-kinase
VALRNAGFDLGWLPSDRLPCRVLSVGNLTVGGTGKTACVELIVRALVRRGARVAVLSRGYGAPAGEYSLRVDGGRMQVDGRPRVEGRLADEPQLLAARLPGVPVFVGARRARTGEQACRGAAAQVVVLDDGFQHRQLQRDCDVVLVQARMPFGGWALLPRGPMREPVSALKRAQVLIITKADEALSLVGALRERLRAINPDAVMATAAHAPLDLVEAATGRTHAVAALDGVSVGLLSSIGDPEGFESTVRSLHATVAWHQAFPDHHRYAAADWALVRRRVTTAKVQAVVTTEKDWVRLKALALSSALPAPLWVLRVEMKVLSGGEALDARLDRLLDR